MTSLLILYSTDVLRGPGQGDTGGRDHRRLQGLQGEVRVDEQGRAFMIIRMDNNMPGQQQQNQTNPAWASFKPADISILKHFIAF